MSELEQIKQTLHAFIEEQTSVEVLREMTSRIQPQTSEEPIEIGPEMRARLRRSEEDAAAGRTYSIDDVRAMMEERHPYLKKENR